MAAAAFFPGDRQAFDGHGQDHHREQRHRQPALQAQLVAEQADGGISTTTKVSTTDRRGSICSFRCSRYDAATGPAR
jgi:hypothetical protein